MENEEEKATALERSIVHWLMDSRFRHSIWPFDHLHSTVNTTQRVLLSLRGGEPHGRRHIFFVRGSETGMSVWQETGVRRGLPSPPEYKLLYAKGIWVHGRKWLTRYRHHKTMQA